MYSENNRRSTARRADDEFLRRMLGGELTGDGFPVMNANTNTSAVQVDPPARSVPQLQNNPKVSCNGTERGNADTDCPTYLHAPALAMVYSPKQCWRNLFDPSTGLSHGTIFKELVLPLGSFPENAHKEVKPRRPM